jgi:AMP-polyphosphate phosphotransferase
VLDTLDMSLSVGKKNYEKELGPLQVRLRDLEFAIYEHRAPVIIVYEGWDAAGKGGNIRRLTQRLDPRGYHVQPISAPQGSERTHHYLWRFWRHVPKAGHITIFDRSWYGRVLVERVEGFAKEAEWRRAYREINEFERQLVDFGSVLVKFFLHITPEEQLKRFEARKIDPFRHYKLTDEDWRNREKWRHYEAAVLDMLHQTSTLSAPWTLVEGNCKRFSRLKTLRTVCSAIEVALERKADRRGSRRSRGSQRGRG